MNSGSAATYAVSSCSVHPGSSPFQASLGGTEHQSPYLITSDEDAKLTQEKPFTLGLQDVSAQEWVIIIAVTVFKAVKGRKKKKPTMASFSFRSDGYLRRRRRREAETKREMRRGRMKRRQLGRKTENGKQMMRERVRAERKFPGSGRAVRGGVGGGRRERCLICFLLLRCANKKENESEDPRQGRGDTMLTRS